MKKEIEQYKTWLLQAKHAIRAGKEVVRIHVRKTPNPRRPAQVKLDRYSGPLVDVLNGPRRVSGEDMMLLYCEGSASEVAAYCEEKIKQLSGKRTLLEAML